MSTATANRPESRLVLRAQSGDRSALDDLLRMTQPWLIRFLTGLVRERHDAEDILQDVSIQIYRICIKLF